MDKQFRELLSRIHAEVLKPLGFRKEGGNFRLYGADGHGKIINFQKSAWNSGEECRFTVNIGVYFEAGQKLQNRKFKEYECALRFRPAAVSPRYKSDFWWCIFPGRDMEALFAELKELIETEIMQFFDQIPTKDALLALAKAGMLSTMTGIDWYDSFIETQFLKMGIWKP